MKATATLPAGRFWRWWTSELKSLVPKVHSRKIAVRAPITVRLLADTIEIVDTASRSETLLATLERESSELAGAIARVARQFPSSSVTLSISSELCLARETQVPSHARDDAQQILLLDLEANSPLRSSDVYLAIVDSPDEAKHATVAVASLVVKRSVIDPVLRNLEKFGLQVSLVDAFDDKTGALLPAAFIIDKHRVIEPRWAPKRLAVALAAITLSFTSAHIWLDRQEKEIARIAGLADEAQRQATQMRHVRDAHDRRHAQAAEVESLQKASRARLAAINELSNLLPETTWLTDLDIDDRNVLISGYSPAAASLVALIDSSEIFDGAQLTAPVVFESAEGKDRFSIRFSLALAAGRDKRAASGTRTPDQTKDVAGGGSR